MKRILTMLLKGRIRRSLLLTLALMVTFITTYMLVLPAITLEQDVAASFSGLDLGRSSASSASDSGGGSDSGSASESGGSSDSGDSGSSDSGASEGGFSDSSASEGGSDSGSESGGESSDSGSEGDSSSESDAGESGSAQGETTVSESGETTLSFDAQATETVDGETHTVSVHVETAPEAFPDGTTMTVETVSDQEVLGAVSDAVEGEVTNVSAVSVTFTDENGDQVQPQEGHALNVTVTDSAVETAEEATVVQYSETGAGASSGGGKSGHSSGGTSDRKTETTAETQELETIQDPELQAESAGEIDTENSVTFETTDPTVFAIVETGETEEEPSAEQTEEPAQPAEPAQAGEAAGEEPADDLAETEEAAQEGETPAEPAEQPEEAPAEEQEAAEGEETEEPAGEEELPVMEQIEELIEEITMAEPLEAVAGTGDEAVLVRAEYLRGVFPEGVELKAELIEVEDDYANAAIDAAAGVSDADSSRMQVKAVDITFLVDGEEVQPEGDVKITLQAPFLSTADTAEVVHMDNEGNGTVVASEAAEEDAVSLTTDSFSVYAIVYTVDFHYNDYTYNLAGGGSIKLSKLLELLEIPVDLSQVADVTFSDPDLLEVAYQQPIFSIYGDWLLTSLAPFSTDETLTLTLVDGSVVTIHVTDEQKPEVDISNTLESVVITVDGKKISADQWGELVKGKVYSLTFTFRENDEYQFPNEEAVMVYALPDGLQAVEKSNATFTMPLGAWGELPGNTYDIKNGVLYVHWNTSHEKFRYLTASDIARLVLDIDVMFDGKQSSIEFSSTVSKTVDVHEPHDVGVNKKGSFDAASDRVNYVVTVDSTGSTTGVKVADTISGTALTFDPNSLVVKKNGSVITVPDGQLVKTETGFTITGMSLDDKDRLTVEYSAVVDYDKLSGNGQMTFAESANSVRVHADQDDDKTNNSSQTYGHTVSPYQLSKSAGNFGSLTEEGEKKYREVPWTITSNQPQKVPVARISDQLDSSCTSYTDYSGSGINVKVTLPNGTTVNRTLEWNGNSNSDANGTLTLASDGNSWTYVPPASDGAAAYEITYTTKVEVTDGNKKVKNTATDDKNEQSTTDKWVPGDGTKPINKKATYHDTKYTDWTISVAVPAKGYGQVTVEEILPMYYVDRENGTVYDELDTSYGKNGFIIEGLLSDEGYEISGPTVRDDQNKVYTITFYANRSANQTGLQGTGDSREIVIKVRTTFNPLWVENALMHGDKWRLTHTNNATITADEKSASDDASVVYSNLQMEKKLIDGPSEFRLVGDGGTAKVYRYEVIIDGIFEDGLEIFDEFDTNLFQYVDRGSIDWPEEYLFKPGGLYGGDQYYCSNYLNTYVTATPTDKGVVMSVNKLPRDAEGNFYPRYRVVYYLALKDEALLKQRAMDSSNGTYTFSNTARYKDVSSNTVETDYEYKVIDKSVVGSENGNRIQKFKIDINPDRLKLNNGQTMTLTDTFSKSLAIDYGSIEVETEPANQAVSYDFRGQTGTFIVPDETRVVITYSARVIGDGQVEFSNTATLNDMYTDDVSELSEQNASLSGDASVFGLRLYKYPAEHMETFLPGAVFRILDSNKDPITVTSKATTSWGRSNVGEDITFTSTAEGMVDIILRRDDHGTVIRKNTVYYLEEIQAPPGYQRDYTLYSFIISDDPDYEPPDGRMYVYQNADILKVRNWPGDNKTRLIISKRFTGNEELTKEQMNKLDFKVTGPDGFSRTISYRDFQDGVYMLDGLAPGDYTVTEKNAKKAVENTDYKVDVLTTYKVGNGEERLSESEDASATLSLREGEDGAVSFTNNYSTRSLEITKVDGATDQPLKGAEFTVYDQHGAVRTYTSGYDGKLEVKFKDGCYSKNTLYYITETKAPDGFQLPADPQKIYFYFDPDIEKSTAMPDYAANLSFTDKREVIENGASTELTVTKHWQDKNGSDVAPGASSVEMELWRVSTRIKITDCVHDYVAQETEATCTTEGGTVYTCSKCCDSYTEDPTPALGHDWGEWTVTTPATESASGVETRTCSRCGETETRTTEALSHTHTYTEAVTQPTCTEKGYTTHTCACGDSYVDTYTDALGHNWGEWTVTKAATATEPGVQTRTCSRCGSKNTKEIPATGGGSTGSGSLTLKVELYSRWGYSVGKGQVNYSNRDQDLTIVITNHGTKQIDSLTNDHNGVDGAFIGGPVSNGVAMITFKPSKVDGDTLKLYYSSGDNDGQYYRDVTVTVASDSVSTFSVTPPQRLMASRPATLSASLTSAPATQSQSAALSTLSGDLAAQTANLALMSQTDLKDFLAQGEKYSSFTLSAADNWTRTFTDLPAKSGGVAYKYYVLEKTGAGYSIVGYSGEGTDHVTVYNQVEDFTFSFTKEWYGPGQTDKADWPTDSSGSYVPITVTIKDAVAGTQVLRGQITPETASLGSNGVQVTQAEQRYTFTVSGLQAGRTYTVTEEAPSGYHAEYVLSNGNLAGLSVESTDNGGTIQNHITTYALPATGGVGDKPFVLGGTALVLAAVLGFGWKRRQER